MTDFTKRLADVQNLMENAATQGEAEAAAQAFQRMILTHNLSEEQARNLTKTARAKVVTLAIQLCPDGDPGTMWRQQLIKVLAQFNFARAFRSSADGGEAYVIGERETVFAIAKMFFAMLETFERLALDTYNTRLPKWAIREDLTTNDRLVLEAMIRALPNPVDWRYSFLRGVPTGLLVKFEEERTREVQEIEGVEGLVAVKDGEIDAYMAENFDTPVRIEAAEPIDRRAWLEGVRAGYKYREEHAIRPDSRLAIEG